VYRLPCAGFAEKDGSFTNSARWMQWKNAAVPVPANCRLDQAIVAQIFLKTRELYQKDGGKFPDPILKLTWNYTDPKSPSLAEVLKEVNGKTFVDVEDPVTKVQLKAGQQLPGFAWLKDDGTTACGNWIYSGSYTEAGNTTATPAIRLGWACIRTGASPGRRIAAYFITARRATWMGNPGILRDARCGGANRDKSGLAMMYPTLKRIRNQQTTWVRSS